jgi:hypothetical protein
MTQSPLMGDLKMRDINVSADLLSDARTTSKQISPDILRFFARFVSALTVSEDRQNIAHNVIMINLMFLIFIF